MVYNIKKFKVPSVDGIHQLSAIAYIPAGEIKGIFHVVHGMTEYIGRYESFFKALAECGYLACGYDNLGHGYTVNDSSELGFIDKKRGYELLIDDVKNFADYIKAKCPDVPYILMGHSMGSLIARSTAARYKGEFSHLILSGTGGFNPLGEIGLALIKLFIIFKGAKGYSNLIENMAFGAYNKRYPGKTDHEWLTTDRDIIDKYMADPFCTFHFTLSAMYDLVKLNSICNKKPWYKAIPKDLPILIISGCEDPVADYGKGVTQVHNDLIKSGAKTSLIIYPNCRHEILNDSCKETVIKDILKFIK